MTLPYELAKKLKGAGFPNIHWHCVKKDHDCRADLPDCKIQILSTPSLSELIEACGDDFRNLTKKEGKWFCPDWRIHPYSTPEEAVANLWLSLQGK